MAHRTFNAPRWLRASHLQTLGAALPLWSPPRGFRAAQVQRLRIPVPARSGGAAGALHGYAFWHAPGEPRPVVVLVHGVGGSSESRYVVRAAYRAGWHVVRLDLRGAGESIADAPTLYHAGLTEDPRLALEHLATDPRVGGVALVGFSLGGHVLLRLAGEMAEGAGGTSLRAVVSISAPVDLTRVTRAIERRRSLPYHQYVLHNLLRQGRDFARAHPTRAKYDGGALDLFRIRSVRAYDAHVIAPMHGFASAEDYYERASAAPLLKDIRVPTLMLHAEDDPMVPAVDVRAAIAKASPVVEHVITSRGGHVGWFAALDESAWVDTWAMKETIAFLRKHAPSTGN